jgi:3-phosphoshikimate 1-carboxyvinyltransferase
MLECFGIEVGREGLAVSVEGGGMPQGRDFHVPGDISSAAFWIVAAAARPGATLTLRRIGLNPTRTAILDVIERMGATVIRRPDAHAGAEVCGALEIRGAELKGTTIEAHEVPNLIDEIPVLAVAGALARGRTSIRQARELRVKETDRIATTVANLRAMKVEVEEYEDGLEVVGGPLSGAEIDSFGDHRIAMAFAIAGLFAAGETRVRHTACVQTSYPGFERHLAAVQDQRTDAASYQLPVTVKES